MSKALTVSVPTIADVAASGSTTGPATLARATHGTPMRALLYNAGGTTILVTFDVQAVSNLTSVNGAFVLDPGHTQIFVLEPDDVLYAVSMGAAGQLSIHTSPAFPLGSWAQS